jgi:hypothetical protein
VRELNKNPTNELKMNELNKNAMAYKYEPFSPLFLYKFDEKKG